MSAPSDLAHAERQERTIERLQSLVEASKVLNSTLDLGELFEIILRITSEHTEAERASLFLVDPERRELFTLLAQGLEQKEIRLPLGKGLVGSVAESGETLNLTDAYEDPFDGRGDLDEDESRLRGRAGEGPAGRLPPRDARGHEEEERRRAAALPDLAGGRGRLRALRLRGPAALRRETASAC